MPKLLEVIVTSPEEAKEAEAGGANRLELARTLEAGGLTPGPAIVRAVVESVSIPVRVILRERDSLTSSGAEEIARLREIASLYAALPIDGFVLGFAKRGQVDLEATDGVLSGARNCRATFHRAFDETQDSLAAIRDLKLLPQIDRVLTNGGQGDWRTRQARLLQWERAAHPEIEILFAIGLDREAWENIGRQDTPREVHTGRAARHLEKYEGAISRARVAALKGRLL